MERVVQRGLAGALRGSNLVRFCRTMFINLVKP
jgi:hypothetical protein